MFASRGEGGLPRRRADMRFGTRGRIAVAFASLTVAFGVAFGVQLRRLGGMEGGIRELRQRQEDMHVALDLEDAVRAGYGLQDRAIDGDDAALAEYEENRDKVATLARVLAARLHDPQLRAGVSAIEAAERTLDVRFRER